MQCAAIAIRIGKAREAGKPLNKIERSRMFLREEIAATKNRRMLLFFIVINRANTQREVRESSRRGEIALARIARLSGLPTD